MDCNFFEEDGSSSMNQTNGISKENVSEKVYSEDDKNTSCYVSYSSHSDDSYLDVEYENVHKSRDIENHINDNNKNMDNYNLGYCNFNDVMIDKNIECINKKELNCLKLKKNILNRSENYNNDIVSTEYSDNHTLYKNCSGTDDKNYSNNKDDKISDDHKCDKFVDDMDNNPNNHVSNNGDPKKCENLSPDNDTSNSIHKNNNTNINEKKNGEKKFIEGHFLSVINKFKRSLKENVIGKKIWNNNNSDITTIEPHTLQNEDSITDNNKSNKKSDNNNDKKE